MKRSPHAANEEKRQALRVARLNAAKWAKTNLMPCSVVIESNVKKPKRNTQRSEKENETYVTSAVQRASNDIEAKESLCENMSSVWIVDGFMKIFFVFLLGVVTGYTFSGIEMCTIVNVFWNMY